MAKRTSADLALLGGQKLFAPPRSTSNLVRPDFARFLEYSRLFYAAGQYTAHGSVVQELERRLALFHHTRYCVTFCSGFWVLVLAIRALALPGRTEVVMPSLTYRRLADVVAWAELVPRFCDVDERTLAISPETVEPHLGPNTALIIGVHPIVNCCDAVGLEELANRYNFPILFDGVESVYETVAGRKVGSFGQGECFSFHASKLLNGFEGGYLTTNDENLASHLSILRNCGRDSSGTVVAFGTNAHLNEVHAAMALASLDDVEAQVPRNRDRYRTYQKALGDFSGIRLLTFDETEQCSFKNIVVELTDEWPLSRAVTLAILNAEGILARAYYFPPLHLKETTYPTITGPLPVTEFLAQRYLLMPCGHFVTQEDIIKMVELLGFLREHAAEIAERAAACTTAS